MSPRQTKSGGKKMKGRDRVERAEVEERSGKEEVGRGEHDGERG